MLTSNIEHIVECRGATKNFTSRPIQTTAVNAKAGPLLWNCSILPVYGRLLNQEDALRHIGDGTLRAARFQKKHFNVRILRQPIRNDTASRASTDNNVIVGLQ